MAIFAKSLRFGDSVYSINLTTFDRMITIKEAIAIAHKSLADIYGQLGDVQVEEYAIDSQRKHWLVTVSFTVRSQDADSIASLIPEKKWKTFSIDVVTGDVTYMVAGGAGELLR